MNKIMETVPNFSEGRSDATIAQILACFKDRDGVKLLDLHRDVDHNRMVVTAVGEPHALKHAVVEAVGVAIQLIDMRTHRGEHPRMGAVDVIPFIPVRNVTMEDAIALSKEVAKTIWAKYRLPVFLYEESASTPDRKDLAHVRKGQFEGMAEKLMADEWKPDFGEREMHPTAGVVAVGARMPLIAFNVNLDTNDIEIARRIARTVRYSSGGLKYCKAIGIALKQRNVAQVSMNMTDYTQTPLYQALELVRTEARRYGVGVLGSEIVGLVPLNALVDSAAYYMGLEDFDADKILEAKLME
ncbi:MAG TPA: glutamate formimidoyltransferase [Syntrophorhabdaceae bacterium]|nr:glutamate formimidoyltransferase [Syntrophorhabdaceae bacterium]